MIIDDKSLQKNEDKDDGESKEKHKDLEPHDKYSPYFIDISVDECINYQSIVIKPHLNDINGDINDEKHVTEYSTENTVDNDDNGVVDDRINIFEQKQDSSSSNLEIKELDTCIINTHNYTGNHSTSINSHIEIPRDYNIIDSPIENYIDSNHVFMTKTTNKRRRIDTSLERNINIVSNSLIDDEYHPSSHNNDSLDSRSSIMSSNVDNNNNKRKRRLVTEDNAELSLFKRLYDSIMNYIPSFPY